MALSKLEAGKKLSSAVNTVGHANQLAVPFRQGRRRYLIIKRILDICSALAGLIIFSPLFVLIPILIKLDDPVGPVFFKQIRTGMNGKTFTIYKFRSMVHQAEDLLAHLLDKNEMTGAMFKMKKDPRITRIGRFLRKSSLDELPQFVNVLKGDMSLVGPRPPLPSEVEKYSDYDKQRLIVQPGCTGLWQVEGRSSTGFETMVRLDIEYINRRGVLLDLKIIYKTIFVFFNFKNAF